MKERAYIACSGATDATLGAPGADVVPLDGYAPLASGLDSRPVASLLRFELADNADETRNIPAGWIARGQDAVIEYLKAENLC